MKEMGFRFIAVTISTHSPSSVISSKFKEVVSYSINVMLLMFFIFSYL